MAQRTPDELIGCPDCGLLQSLPRIPSHSMAECARCGHALAHGARDAIAPAPLALAVTALLLLVPAVLMPLMELSSFGRRRSDSLPGGAGALWHDGFGPLASVVFLFSIALPIAYLLLLIGVLGPIRAGKAGVRLGRRFRWALQLRPWAMIEVYLVGCCVAYSRLQSVGSLKIEAGGWCLLAAAAAMTLLALRLDDHWVWQALGSVAAPALAGPELAGPELAGRPLSCGACNLVLEARFEFAPCPRCALILRRREPRPLARTLALVLAGALLYVPANVLPVLRIDRFGHEQSNTILSGVRELTSSGLWPLAILVFSASILVPLLKLMGLGAMILLTRMRSRRALLGRTRLYRFIDFVGRWSSIDLFMISILVALVQFGTLTSVRPAAGAVAFAAVVILTMLASRSFDPRVMWDAMDNAG